jgi:drug/metabolite transporter (DMT)-like permease
VRPAQRPLLAFGLRVAAALTFATLLTMVKWASESGVSLPELMFWRQAGGLPLLVAYLFAAGQFHRVRTRRIASHAARAGLGSTNMIFNFGAAILLPLAEATTLGFTSPLFAVIVAAVILKERIGRYRWLSVLLGFAGIVIIAQPGAEPLPPLGIAAALIAALMLVAINHQIRDLGRTEEPITVVFWFTVFGTLLTGAFLPFFATAHSPEQWLVLFGIGVSGIIGQLFLTASLRYGPVASVMIMDYTGLIWATLYGWLLWDRLPPTATWVGAPAIVAASLVIAWREHKLAKAPSPRSTLAAD